MKQLLTFSFCLLAFAGFAQQEPPHIHYLPDPDGAERQHSVDITHMKLEVSFEPQLGKVKGTVTHEFTTIQKDIDTLFFDGPGITILSAQMDGKDVPFTTNKEGVVVRFSKHLNWDEKHSIVFNYTALPKRGIYFIGWNEPENTGTPDITYIRKQIWTQGQGTDNRYWIPMYDALNDKFITETVVSIESKYKVLSNGKRLGVQENTNGTTTWHYTMEKPHSGYLLMLGIGNYNIKESRTKRGTLVQFWYYPEFKDRVEYTSLGTEKMIELLEETTGTPYAWGGTYSQIMVQNFLYGAMENTTATVFGDFFTVDARAFKDRNYMGVNCHELTHQWFGDLITARGGSDHWLQESFATFFPKLFFKELDGYDAYQWILRGEYEAALNAGKIDNYPVKHTKAGSPRHYPKGSAVLSMLYYQLGEDNFTRFIQHYLSVNAYKNVDTYDLQKALKDKLGLNYDWFFDEWIHRGGEPSYKVSYKANKTATVFNIQQTQKTDGHIRYFKMPMVFAIYYKNGNVFRDTIMVMDSANQNISIPNKNGDEISFALIDEESRVLKKMDFAKGKEELMAQAANAKYMIDRYDAVVGLNNTPFNEKSAFLQARFAAEKHFGIRAEIAKQLANQKSMNKWYLNVVKDRAEVKNAFISADTLVIDQKSIFEMLIKDSSYAVTEAALDKLMKCKEIANKDKQKYLVVVKGTNGISNSVKVKWLEYAYQYNPVNDSKAELTKLCGPTYEFRTRVNAANALKRLKLFDEAIAKNLIDAALTYNGRLAGPCVDVLKEFKKVDANNKLIQGYIAALSPESQERLKLAGI